MIDATIGRRAQITGIYKFKYDKSIFQYLGF